LVHPRTPPGLVGFFFFLIFAHDAVKAVEAAADVVEAAATLSGPR
jgi:hypothetical protein